tara:strand:- start:2867 stop:4015 length:1149 start_codon:yes stop_codon:yes gene_type:complete
MEDNAFPEWPAEEDEVSEGTAEEKPEQETHESTAESVEQAEETAEITTKEESTDSESADADAPGDELPATASAEAWTLPVRAAPILALQGEKVVEFPLSQHVNGLESTSLVMDDELMRIVEARYDADGVRRLNVRMALVKEHISGYSHTHLDLFQKLQGVWWGSIGFGLLSGILASATQGLLALGGGAFVLAGVAGLLLAKLDLHRLSFSDHGGRHDFYLSGWRQEPYLIHNSTALLGPAFVEFLRTSTLDTEHIDAVIDALGAPAQPAPELQSAPEVPAPAVLPEPTPPATPVLPPPPSANNTPAPPTAAASSGPPISTPTPAPPQPLPAPPAPVQHAPPPPTLPAAPLPAPLPPAPLPPPLAPAMMKSNVDEDALWDDLS